jgi:chromosome segregation ATPase
MDRENSHPDEATPEAAEAQQRPQRSGPQAATAAPQAAENQSSQGQGGSAQGDQEAATADADDGKPPQSLLDELKSMQEQADAEARKHTSRSQALQADIGALAKDLDATTKAADASAKNRSSLDQQLGERKTYIGDKTQVIVAAIGDDRDDIDKAWDAVQADLRNLRQGRDQQRTQLGQLLDAQAQKQRDADLAREQFVAVTERLTGVQGRIAKLTALRARIEAAEDASNAADMYSSLREFNFQLGRATEELESSDPKPVSAYRRKLEDAWRTLNEKQQALRDATQARSEKQAELDQTKAKIERLEANRVDEVLKRFAEAKAEPATTTSP